MSYFLNTDEIVQTIRMIEQECMRPIMTCITIGLILFEKHIGLCFGGDQKSMFGSRVS